MKPRLDAFIFDMDGTLLDTLPDLTDITNATMAHFGFPTHTQEEILTMVGHGLRSLMSQAMPAGLDTAAIDACIAYWRDLYDREGDRKTRPYPGMVEILDELKARGKKLAVFSNKYDGGTRLMTERYFSSQMDFAVGEGPVPRKPDPAGLILAAHTLGVDLCHVAFVGDSHADIETARNAGAFSIAVTWGYQPLERLVAAHPDTLITSPADLLDFA